MRHIVLTLALVGSLVSCSGGDSGLQPPKMDLLACKITLEKDAYSFGEPIGVRFERDPSYKPPAGFNAIPCHSLGLGAGTIEVLEQGEVVHVFNLGMVQVTGVPFTHRVTLNKYHLTSKRGSFVLRAVNHDWRSNTVSFDLD